MSLLKMFLFGVFLVLLSPATPTMVKSPSISDSFKECLLTKPASSLGYCLGVGAMAKLQTIDNEPEFDIVDGVTLAADEQQLREAYNFVDRDPGDFRSILDSISHVFTKRSLRWDMSYLYPGLIMRVAPSASPGGMLEFALDSQREAFTQHALKEVSTGRILARQFLVPLLLGFKFNVATLIPIIFGLLAIVAKKALILSKIALVITSAFAISSLLFSNKYPSHGGPPHYQHGGGYGHYNKYPEPEEHYNEPFYRDNSGYNEDQLRLYDSQLQKAYANSREDQTKGRNFAWSDTEKVTKT